MQRLVRALQKLTTRKMIEPLTFVIRKVDKKKLLEESRMEIAPNHLAGKPNDAMTRKVEKLFEKMREAARRQAELAEHEVRLVIQSKADQGMLVSELHGLSQSYVRRTGLRAGFGIGIDEPHEVHFQTSEKDLSVIRQLLTNAGFIEGHMMPEGHD